MNKSHADCADTPTAVYALELVRDVKMYLVYKQHYYCDPQAGAKALHHHVGWDFSSDVEWEEHRESMVILEGIRTFGRHVKVFLKFEKLRISNVGTI